jgi:hypothetical protein
MSGCGLDSSGLGQGLGFSDHCDEPLSSIKGKK